MAKAEAKPICAVEDVPEGGTIGAIATLNGERQRLIVVRKDGIVRVYVNRCPHIGAPLDFRPGRFLNADGTHILCANHGALFEIADGSCVHGPCPGQSLEAVSVEIRTGQVFVKSAEPHGERH